MDRSTFRTVGTVQAGVQELVTVLGSREGNR
jgi:hypothetical protein